MVRHVLFPLSTPLSFAVVEPLCRALLATEGVAVSATARHGGRRAVRALAPSGVRAVGGLPAHLRRFDLALCPGYYFRSLRRYPTVELFHGVSPKNYAVRREALRFDRLFLIGPYHRRKFVRAGLFAPDDPRLVDVGMPKTDPLARAAGRPRREGRPRILYAPTRSGSAGSSLERFGPDLLERLLGLDADVVVKLHDRSHRRYRAKLAVDWPRELARRFAGTPVRLARGHDVVPLLLEADLLITDLSSVAAEFLLLDRPVVFLAVPEHERRISDSGRRRFGADDPEDLAWFLEAGERARDPDEALAAVRRALDDPSARSKVRRARARALFYNPGRATAAALGAVLSLLDEAT